MDKFVEEEKADTDELNEEGGRFNVNRKIENARLNKTEEE